MALEQVYTWLGWPHAAEIFEPTGAGARYLVDLAEEKIGRAIARLPDGEGVRVGVLTSTPSSAHAPIALLCEFPRPVSEQTLLETQKLAWNFAVLYFC